ncbi:hypothetical protein EXIGLDRAFT_758412 [Exidia glandulosa HHB12029]|uniref:Uncharacterized protein n=1 Tax=Exidia glandulosa HHB12029 TaxID=1314781 RepID=A0A165QV07_EXIGL|nr:hypothetical protein EXIGLDRAFT_758412 [Exidia glandulosa HHB12029]
MRIASGLVFGVAFSAVAAETVTLHHRVLGQDGSSSPFTVRGTVDVDNALALRSSASAAVYSQGESLQSDIRHILERAAREPQSLYQVALERAHDTGEAQWPVSSVKLCHLRTGASDVVRLHIDQRTGSPFALDYFLLSTPHDGACPPVSAQSTATPLSNTTVVLRLPSRSPSPLLRTPPPMTAEGTPVPKEAERSFLQKYWPYIVGFLVIQFVLGSSPPEENPEGGAAPPAPAK